MSDRSVPVLPKWPFIAGNVLLLAVAMLVATQSSHPLSSLRCVLCVGAVLAGAALAVIPFLMEYKAAVKFVETAHLADTVAQIQGVKTLAAQIGDATARWQEVQAAASKTANAAQDVTDRMAAEVRAFAEFMQHSNDAEKNALRLEVEKSRRAEGDWVQIIVRMLDHVYALHQAGARSGQPELSAQLDHFQNACRDVVRRVGLIPFVAAEDELFTAERHKVFDGETPAEDARVGETLAAGYTYQGRLLRPALVKLRSPETPAAAPEEKEKPVTDAEPSLL
jgi:molecular chaperone GrpE (heat shock protein)